MLKVIETFGRWRGRTRSEVTVRLVRSGERYEGKQGMSYRRGLTGDTVGSQAISMTVLVLPGGARGKTHLHHGIESAAYVLDGRFDCFYGPRLEDHIEIGAGDLVYIPADVAHLVLNRSASEAAALVAHTAASDQDGIVLLPELDALIQ